MSKGSNRSWGITVLRVAVGIVFLMHGIQKLFSIGVPGVEGFMGALGIPFPRFFGVVLTLVELFGGAALIFGVATRLTALLLAVDMLVAIIKVHLKNGFFMPNGFEFTLTLLAANLCLLLAGAGAASVDGALWGEKREPSADPVKRQV
jgi:putative oxidoreductase